MAGLYIHIPYCVRKCLYCDFVSYVGAGDISAMIPYLCAEMQMRRDTLTSGERIESVFIGGGTPSLLDGIQMKRLLDAAFSCYQIGKDTEITVECNPGTLSREKLAAFRRAGINRLSIGLQSADDTILRTIGRIHTYDDFASSMRFARAAGFDNINVDVMHGLPGQTEKIYIDTLEKATSFPGVTHVSSYMLILEENTPLYALVNGGKIILPSDDETADMDDAGILFLENNGYMRYEISNFAKNGYTCKHNINYWKNGQYIGIGPAAHGASRIDGSLVRYENMTGIGDYRNSVGSRLMPENRRTPITEKEERFETVMLALRMTEGLDLLSFERRFGADFTRLYPMSINQCVKNGWGYLSDTRFFLTKHGLDMQNTVLLSFMEERTF